MQPFYERAREELKRAAGEEAPLAREIQEVCEELAHFLIAKNQAYGNSAAEPLGVFAKRFDALAQIDVRIDDKLNRLAKGREYPGDDTVLDLAGYLVLRMVLTRRMSAQGVVDPNDGMIPEGGVRPGPGLL